LFANKNEKGGQIVDNFELRQKIYDCGVTVDDYFKLDGELAVLKLLMEICGDNPL